MLIQRKSQTNKQMIQHHITFSGPSDVSLHCPQDQLCLLLLALSRLKFPKKKYKGKTRKYNVEGVQPDDYFEMVLFTFLAMFSKVSLFRVLIAKNGIL